MLAAPAAGESGGSSRPASRLAGESPNIESGTTGAHSGAAEQTGGDTGGGSKTNNTNGGGGEHEATPTQPPPADTQPAVQQQPDTEDDLDEREVTYILSLLCYWTSSVLS